MILVPLSIIFIYLIESALTLELHVVRDSVKGDTFVTSDKSALKCEEYSAVEHHHNFNYQCKCQVRDTDVGGIFYAANPRSKEPFCVYRRGECQVINTTYMHLNNKTYLNPKLLTVRDVSGDTAASNKNFKDDWTFEDSETFHRKRHLTSSGRVFESRYIYETKEGKELKGCMIMHVPGEATINIAYKTNEEANESLLIWKIVASVSLVLLVAVIVAFIIAVIRCRNQKLQEGVAVCYDVDRRTGCGTSSEHQTADGIDLLSAMQDTEQQSPTYATCASRGSEYFISMRSCRENEANETVGVAKILNAGGIPDELYLEPIDSQGYIQPIIHERLVENTNS